MRLVLLWIILLAAVNAQAVSPIYGPSGNATVPGSVPILPVQVWVNNIAAVYTLPSGDLNLSNKGITHFDSALLYIGGGDLYSGRLPSAAAASAQTTINLSSNTIPASEVNAILAAVVRFQTDWSTPQILIMNGTGMPAPTGQGIIDKASLISNAWTVTTN